MKYTTDKRIYGLTRGFTLVETLVAISVLLVAIVGPMSIAAQGLQASFFAREQTTAVYLAQEAIEAVERQRDSAALSAVYELTPRIWQLCQNDVLPASSGEPIYDNNPEGSPYRDQNVCESETWQWYSDLNTEATCDQSDGSLGCDYNSVSDTFRSCDLVSDCTLKKGTDFSMGRYYQYAEGDPSQFTRVITLSEESEDEVLVTVTVSWQATLFGGSDSQVILQTRLLDQYE